MKLSHVKIVVVVAADAVAMEVAAADEVDTVEVVVAEEVDTAVADPRNKSLHTKSLHTCYAGTINFVPAYFVS